MNLFKLIYIRGRLFYFMLLAMSVVSSITNILILSFIGRIIRGGTLSGRPMNEQAIIYLVLVVFSFLATVIFQRYMIEVTNGIAYDIELSIIEKIRIASYETFEKMGVNRLYSAISDARTLSRIPTVLVNLVNAVIAMVCGIGYLFYISIVAGAALFLIMLALLAVYIYRDKRISDILKEVRDLQDKHYEHLDQLLSGFRQMKVSEKRTATVFGKYLLPNREKSKDLSILALRRYSANELSGTYSWYIILGIVIFLLPVLFGIRAAQTSAFVTTILFMMAPLLQIVVFIPSYSMFKISLERIEELERQLDSDPVTAQAGDLPPDFSTIRFENIKYKHDKTNSDGFELNISSFTISRNEIVFLTGGNGSGKTTLINLLTGLYKPDSGNIFIDDKEVEWEEFKGYVNRVAVIFSNQHLFKYNYDEHDLSSGNRTLKKYRKIFNLDEVMRIDPTRQSIVTDLSRGQQKRVSLLLSLLEDTPIIILDEWAAEQDPLNKPLFYEEWLRLIRESGKSVIAVTHDAEFFQHSDRIVHLNNGVIVNSDTEIDLSNKAFL